MVLKMRKRNERSERFLEQMRSIYGDTLSFPNLNYHNRCNKVLVRCNIHNFEYEAWPTNLARGKRGCLKCCGILTREDFIVKSRAVHGDVYNYDKVKFINTTTKVTITCPKHGDWDTKPFKHYHSNGGTGCPQCAIEKSRLSLDRFIETARTIHGDKYNYDMVAIEKQTSIVKIGCPIHGYFNQEARVHLSGSGCKLCFNARNKNTLEGFIAKAKEVHGNTYDYSRAVYVNSKVKLTVICKLHGEFYIKPNSHNSSKTGCPRCRESYGERLIAKHLSELNIKFKKECALKDSRYRFDFYLPDHNVLIEFHGVQHYEPVERFGGVKGHLATISRDYKKLLLVAERNIPLIVLNHLDLTNDALYDKLNSELIKLNIISQTSF